MAVTAKPQRPSEEAVGSSMPLSALAAALLAVVIVAAGVLLFTPLAGREPAPEIVIATGSPAGTYHALGVALGGVLEENGVVASALVQATDGSVTNIGLIGSGAADLALVQSDTPANERVRLVARLYDEVLHILVAAERAAEIRSVQDLQGRTVVVGSAGSGTRQVALRILDHFGVEPGRVVEAPPEAALEELAAGSVDALFLLAAIPSPTVQLLCERDLVRFLPLGEAQQVGNEADAIALVYPNLHAVTIPRATYGRLPLQPVQTVSVVAQLVASESHPPALVHRITATLFERRARMEGSNLTVTDIAERIRERYEPGLVRLPYHPGAVAYYERSRPPFLVEYAESISLALTVLVGLYSAWIGLRQWLRRRRKNRIDAYYVEAVEHAADPEESDLAILRARRAALVQLRRQAFADLVAEKLDANESFTILQDHIAGELEMIAARLEAARTHPSGGVEK